MRTLRYLPEGAFVKLGAAIRRRRKSLGLTQADTAALAGCAELFVREVEKGKQTVQFDKLVGVAQALGLELRVAIGPRGLVVGDGE